MAVQDCDKISNIVAIQLLAWNDDLAKEIAELAATKNYAQTTIAKLWGEWKDLAWRSVNSLELMAKSAEIKIDAIVQSYILKWQAWEEALMEVAKQMSKTKDSLYWWVKLLEMIRGGSDVDIKEVARLWDSTLNTSEAMKQMEDAIADYTASDYSIYRAYNAIEDTLSDASKKIKDAKQSTKDAKVRLDKGIITDKEFRKIKKENDLTIKTLTKEKEDIKEALKKDYKLAMDKIKEGWNPTGFSKLDSEWAAIKKVFWNEPEKAGRLWTNYIMARELLAWWEMADEVISILAKEWENLAWDLTEEWIVKCTNLDTLIARAFTNTEQLCNNWMLRELYRDKLIQLSAWIRLTEENADKVKTLINTSLFAEEGMTLSDVMLDNRAYRSMKNLGYKVTERDWERILNDLQNIAEKFSEDIFWEEDIVIKIAWQEVKPQDVVQLIYNITWDENIIKLLNSRNFSDTSILSIATQKLLWNNDLARQWIINLFKKGKEWSKVTNVRWVFFRALTGMEVPDWAKVWYFDYRRALYTKDELSDSKARLYDVIADKNKLRVEWDIAWDFTKDWQYSQENVEKLANEIKTNLKWGFLVVNDARWWDNQLLREAVDKLRKEWDLTILYPKGGQMSSFIREWDNLFFKTIDDSIYDNVAWTISIQSLWEAKPTREITASAYEAATGRNWDKLRYQASYNDWWVDSLWRQISDQQVEHFAKSVIRDENGNLLVVYHNTNVEFDIFDLSESKDWVVWVGFYFTPETDLAEEYWGRRVEAYLDIRNPLVLWGDYYHNFWKYITYDKMLAFVNWLRNVDWFEGGMIDRYIGEINRKKYSRDDFGYWARESIMSETKRLNKQSEVLDVLTRTTWYDWIALKPGNGYPDEYVAFSPNQIKSVDNRLPTTDPNIHFQLRDEIEMIDTYVDDDSLKYLIDAMKDATWEKWLFFQRDRFNWIQIWTRDFWGFTMSNVMYRLNTVQDVINIFNKYWLTPIIEKRNWYMREILNRKRGLDKETIDWVIRETLDSSSIKKHIQFNNDGTIKDFTKEDWRLNLSDAQKAQTINRLDLMWDLFNYVSWTEDYSSRMVSLMHNLWIPSSVNWKNIYGNYLDYISKLKENYPLEPSIPLITKYDWQDFDTVLKELYDDWYYPFEFGIEVDGKTWKVKNIMLGNNGSVTPPNKKWVWKVYHNHPNASFFSTQGRNNDLKSFKNSWGKYEWLILPWWVVVEFKNDKNLHRGMFKRWDKQEFYQWQSTLWNAVLDLIAMSSELGALEKQRWWVFADIVEKYKDDIINKNYTSWLISDIWARAREVDERVINNVIDYLTPAWETQPSFMRRIWQYSDQADMPITDALKVQMFTKDRTAEDLANWYWLPIEFIHNTEFIAWVKARWAYWNGILYFTDMVKESTPPHEIFHGVFNMFVKSKDVDLYERVLRESSELFWVSEYKAEEILADSFAEWFRTWEFTYWEKLKKEAEELLSKEWKIKKKGLNKEQKSLVAQVLEYFKEIARQLWILDNHRAEVKQLFDDMVNMKYLPDDWKPVNPETALAKYNKELNDAAVNYFWKMLGLDSTDPLYVRNVETKLSEMLWIDIQTFDSFTDKASLYRRIDKQLALERLTTGNFDRDIVNIGNVRNEINALSEDDLEKQIKDKLWVLVNWWPIKWNENIELIREAWFNYNTAEDMSQLLSAEWKIISLVNWVQPASLSLEDLKTLFKDKDALKRRYKEMFFPEQEVTDKELDMFVRQINWDVYDSLSIQFVENLVKEWYDLPLINAKTAMYDYLNGKLDLNSDFARAFMYKNNIAMTSDNLNAIVEWALPREFSFDFTTFENKLADESLQWDVSRVIKRENQFLPDTYTALSAIEWARAWESLWWAEYQVLKGTIDKYVKAMKEWVRNSRFTFKDAQKLKQDFSYAMDTFEQEIILPKYSKFLTPEERQSLLWIKYTAPIAVWWQNAREVEKMLDNWANRILWREEVWPNWERIIHKWSYQNTMSQLASDNDINVAIAKWYNANDLDEATINRIERRRNQLISNWSTIKEINWEYVVYDVKETLWQTLNNMPSSIEWYAGILALGREWIENLTNKQAYVLLRYLEAAKALATTSNYTTQLMYKQTPLLAQYSFFTTYAVDANTWLPRVMWNNSLASDNFFTDILASNTIDQDIKNDIFSDIIKWFRKNKYVGEDELGEMIDKAISRQIDELWKLNTFSPQEIETARWKMKNIYTNMFIPYSYLRDLPVEWGIKEKLESTIKEAYNQAIKDLKAAWASDTDDIQKMIMIRMDDWSSKNLSDLANVKIDDWKKTIFNDESILVRWADEVDVDESQRFWEDSLDVENRVAKEQKRLRENIQNQYAATLKAIENQSQIISDSERELMVSFMSDVRTDLRKYSLTNKMVDALDAVSWMWEEVARWMKNYIIWLRWMWTYGKFRTADIWARYDKVREAYRSFYNMPLESLMKAKPRNAAEEVAWNAARYFKNLERMLGSVDWKTWVTTSEAVNKAFYHIWETFMNLWANWASETWWIRWLFWMLSWIEQNQVLKFFKFSNPNQPSYVKMFKQAHRRDERLLEWVGGYRDYVETINNIDRETFNRLFGTNYSDWVFKRVLQWLTWFTLAGGWFARRINKLLDVANSSRLAFRMLMSYPWQLLTIPQQWVAYFLKQIWYEQALWIEDMWRIDAIRESFWVLDWAYNELNITGKLNFNPDSLDKNAFYNRYWIPTMKDLYEETGITTADDYINMYAKVDKKYSKPWKMSSWIKWLDPYKDNANNFIDWIFARNFKNIAFVKWLRDNSYMKFSSAEDFLEFMNDATVSAEVKSRLMDAVAASSGRNFRNILWLGFWWLDRPIGWAGWQNCLYWLMQMLNFRWSWWQNIFKQTWENFWRLYKATLWMPWLSREAREKLVDYLWNTPEFVNFVTAMLHDLEWSFKLTRYQDNGRRPDENEDPWYYFLDYLSYVRETMNMVSQWYQGIQSFWPLRPFHEQMNSILESQMDPTIYHDTWWVWAFFNALWKNFGRQWKPVNWLIEAAWAFESGERANLKAYFEKQFFNLSFWSLRYMVNEDENSYWYTYEVSWQVWWIPSIAMWEAQIWSDKSFMYALDNSETWKAMQLIADDDVAWEDKKKYWGNLRKAFVNGSQLFKTIKNFNKVRKGEYNKSFFSSEDLAWIIQQTKAWKEFYDKWYVIPSTNEEAVTFIKTILNNSEYRPGSKQFNKSLLQFEDFGHMDAAKWNAADAQMELWLEHMKYKTNEHWEFVKKNWERVVDENWNKLTTNVKQYYSNEEYVANVIYNYSKDWLDEHSTDPNYPLYLKMLWQWNANMLIDSELNKIKAIRNKWVKWDLKWTDANLNAAEYRDMLLRMGNSILDWDNITFFEKLNRLDEDDATLAALKIIYDQSTELWRTDIEKFFNIETNKEDDTIVEDVKLKSQYESVLRQIWQIGRAIDEWNADRVIATMSSLTHQFKNDDPTGEITAMIINSTYDRIDEAKNIGPALKNEMMIGLFYDNKDFIQRNPEKLRELLWDAYDEYARKMNEMLYKRDGQIISNMEELVSRNEDNIDRISKATKKWSGASRAIKNAAMKLSWTSGSWTWNWSYRTGQRAWQGYWQRVPVKIKWADLVKELWLKGYNPTNVNEIVFKYTPTADFSLSKDINRKVKTTKTQTVSSKKQLSNIESKTTKALEAES